MRRTTEPSPDSPNQSETPNSPEQYLQPTLPAHPESSAQPKPKAAPLDSPPNPYAHTKKPAPRASHPQQQVPHQQRR
uniref:hypothetical protein n=1 Tax=Rothia dentocariosa TaxID=2047 RepID=UPI00113039FD